MKYLVTLAVLPVLPVLVMLAMLTIERQMVLRIARRQRAR